ncbi:hypothetical protein MRX96_048405 [Rhipicephalus microplus]
MSRRNELEIIDGETTEDQNTVEQQTCGDCRGCDLSKDSAAPTERPKTDATLPSEKASDCQQQRRERPSTKAGGLKGNTSAMSRSAHSSSVRGERRRHPVGIAERVFLEAELYFPSQAFGGPQATEPSFLMSNGSFEQSTTETDSSGNASWFPIASCVLGLVPGVVACVILTVYILSSDPGLKTTLEEGLGSGSSGSAGGSVVVPILASSPTVTSEAPALETTTRGTIGTSPTPTSPATLAPTPSTPSAAVSTTPVPETVSPHAGANDSVCNTEQCHFLAQWIRQKLEPNADPCVDFYTYVCGTFDGPKPNVVAQTAMNMLSIIVGAAHAAHIPASGQSSWQKAAGMFQACMTLAKERRSESALPTPSGDKSLRKDVLLDDGDHLAAVVVAA